MRAIAIAALLITACGGPESTMVEVGEIRAVDTACKRFDPPSTAPQVTACVARWTREIGCIEPMPLESDLAADNTCLMWSIQFADAPVEVGIIWSQRALYPLCSQCYR